MLLRKGQPTNAQDWKAYFSEATVQFWLWVAIITIGLAVAVTAILDKTPRPTQEDTRAPDSDPTPVTPATPTAID